jgi:hypothetical protein
MPVLTGQIPEHPRPPIVKHQTLRTSKPKSVHKNREPPGSISISALPNCPAPGNPPGPLGLIFRSVSPVPPTKSVPGMSAKNFGGELRLPKCLLSPHRKEPLAQVLPMGKERRERWRGGFLRAFLSTRWFDRACFAAASGGLLTRGITQLLDTWGITQLFAFSWVVRLEGTFPWLSPAAKAGARSIRSIALEQGASTASGVAGASSKSADPSRPHAPKLGHGSKRCKLVLAAKDRAR